MTTDRAGPKGHSTEREVSPRPAVYWCGLGGFYCLNIDGVTVLWSNDHDVTSWQPGETGSFVADVVNSAGPWELTHDNGLFPETPAKPAGDPNG